MRVVLLGINHRTAPVAVREQLSISGDAVAATLAALRDRFADAECVLLSTCNRTELYVATAEQPPEIEALRAFLADRCGVEPAVVAGSTVHQDGEHAVRHLFRVCAGLDSMVLGEPQILGQVKRAYETAAACGAVGPLLHRVFQAALSAAKRIRTTSGLSVGRVSVASVAVDFARQIFEDFSNKTVVGVGAGEMAKVTLRHLLKLAPGHLWLVNRSLERASALADRLQIAPPFGGPRAWDELDDLLVEADIVLTSTGAREPILAADRFRPLLRRRRNRPLFFLDIAVPRDIDPAIGGFSNVYLYNIDDLQRVVSANLGQRHEEVERCEDELAAAAAACVRQVETRDLGQLIRQLRDQLHDIGEAEQQRTLRKLGAVTRGAGADADAVSDLISEHTNRVINKILHLPLSQLDHKDPDAPLALYADALRRLFKLPDEAEPPATPPPPASDAPAPREHQPAEVKP